MPMSIRFGERAEWVMVNSVSLVGPTSGFSYRLDPYSGFVFSSAFSYT
jgi:hypothetical protein